MEAAKRLLPQRELSAVRLTEDKPLPCRLPIAAGKRCVLHHSLREWSPPSAEGGEEDFASAEARRGLSDRPRHPFGSLALKLGRNPTLVGRGGSVSRRDHNQAYRRTHPPHRRNQLCRSNQLKRQPLFGREREGGASLREAASLALLSLIYSSGEGVWGRGASLREAASPPESPQRSVSSGGGPGEALLFREAASPGVLP